MTLVKIFFNVNYFRRYLDTSKLFDNQQLSKEIAIDVLQKVSLLNCLSVKWSETVLRMA